MALGRNLQTLACMSSRFCKHLHVTCDLTFIGWAAGAMEKQKLVYVLNRDQAANLTISSPLEAHKSHNIVFSVIGLDMGFDNPVFAAIELDYADADQASDAGNSRLLSSLWGPSGVEGACSGVHSVMVVAAFSQSKHTPGGLQDPTGEAAGNAQKQLTLYELDLGLNHVTRKWSQEVDNGANLLVPVPGGADGPGGVLVCAENFIIYSNQVRLSPFCALCQCWKIHADCWHNAVG